VECGKVFRWWPFFDSQRSGVHPTRLFVGTKRCGEGFGGWCANKILRSSVSLRLHFLGSFCGSWLCNFSMSMARSGWVSKTCLLILVTISSGGNLFASESFSEKLAGVCIQAG
jgi:hypothetical protein